MCGVFYLIFHDIPSHYQTLGGSICVCVCVVFYVIFHRIPCYSKAFPDP